MNGCSVFPIVTGTYGNWNTDTTTMYFPPTAILAECALTGATEDLDSWAVACSFYQYSSRQADGSDEPINVNQTSVYDPAMSSLTYCVASARAITYARVVMQYW